MAQIKREIASICKVQDLLEGSFVKAEGWTPSYFITRVGNVSRVNLMGFVVSKDGQSFVFDDGSGRILLRSFENPIIECNIGDFVLIIGRPRMYNDEKYIVPEIIKKIDSAWAQFRAVELSRLNIKEVEIPKERKIIEEVVKPENQFQRIFEFIRDLDSGNGADIEEVIARSQISNGEELIRKLIEEGELFEIKPGKLKILE